MGLLIPEFRRLAEDGGRLVNLTGLNNTDPKLVRIRRLGSYLSRRQLRVRNSAGGRLLVEQLRDVPTGEYDDPDALAQLVRCLEVRVNGAA
jgi:hypothetical protein